MGSVIEYFRENTKGYRNKQSSTSSVLANFEMIHEMMKFTDILGTGSCKPHASLVSTSSISLTILNNVTYGDDIQKAVSRNFPSNMILFDLLALVGLSFKCGPEDIVLRQGNRFIPIINNGTVIEDLHFTSEEVIAEKNDANFLKAPEVFKKDKEGVEQLNEPYQKCLREVFDRFSFEGKMSQI
jgi:hypothetical protein